MKQMHMLAHVIENMQAQKMVPGSIILQKFAYYAFQYYGSIFPSSFVYNKIMLGFMLSLC